MFHVEHLVAEKILKSFKQGVFVKKYMEQISAFKDLYFLWNKKHNISSIRTEEGFWVKHVQDSFFLLKYLEDNFDSSFVFVDIGSGAGIPGLILSMCNDFKYILVDNSQKKIDFIDFCVRKLNLLNVETQCLQAKSFQNTCGMAVVVSRALKHETVLEEMSSKNIKNFIFMTTSRMKMFGKENRKYFNKTILYKDIIPFLKEENIFLNKQLFHVKQL